MLGAMKTVTTRKFLHAPGVVKILRPGQQLLVTEHGKPSFVITRAGQRPRRTLADLEREAREICPEALPKVNFTKAMKELEKR